MKDNSKRIAWIDNAKMIAMLFVILGHTWRIVHSPLPEWLNMFILVFNMPIFVILSGYTSYKSINSIFTISDLLVYVEKITKRMLVPSLVFSFIFRFIITLTINGSILNMMIVELIGLVYCFLFFLRDKLYCKKVLEVACWFAIPIALFKSDFWFFKMLWCVAVVVAISKWIIECKKIKTLKLLWVALISLPLALIMNYIHDKTADFILFFLIGICLYRFDFFYKFKSWLFIIMLIVVCSLLLSSLTIDVFNFWDYHPLWYINNNKVGIFFMRVLTSSLISIVILLIIKKLSNKYNCFSEWGTYTLPMYMIHSLIITICYNMNYVYIFSNDMTYMIYAIPMTCVITLLTMYLINISKKYQLTRAFVLGEKLF